MGTVDLPRSLAISAVRRRRRINSSVWVTLRWLVRGLAVASFLVGTTGIVGLVTFLPALVGVALLALAVSLVVLVIDLYLRTSWSAPPPLPPLHQALSANPNLADYLSSEGAELVDRGLAIGRRAGLNRLDPFFLVLAAFDGPSNWFLTRLGISLSSSDIDRLIEEARHTAAPDETLLVHTFQVAAEMAYRAGRPRIDDIDLLAAVFAIDERVKKIAFEFHVEENDILQVGHWLRRFRDLLVDLPLYAQPVGAGLAQDWTAGYTPHLARFAQNLTTTVRAAGKFFHVYGREKELSELERILGKRSGTNSLLVGSPGIGKTTLVLGLAARLAAGKTLPALRYHQVLQLDLGAVLAGVSDRGEIEARLLTLLSDAARAGNVVLYVPDVHLLIRGGERVGGVDASELLMTALRSPNLSIIASTTPEEYQTRLATNPSLGGLFERIDLVEPDPATTTTILEDAAPRVEADSGAFFTEPALRAIVEIAAKTIHDQPFPQKGLNLMAELGSYAAASGEKLITPEVVRQVLSEKLKVPLETATGDEQTKLLNLETALHETVVGQDEAIAAVADALRRARAGLASGKRPIASFLFLGPSGVGKTETARALARVYFGDAERMLRFDMSEYSQPESLVRLLGAPSVTPGVKTGGLLADSVHDHPFSLLLLDELEKAHPQVLNLFLQVFEDGRLTDGTGRLIDFTNAIIIATSNAGAELIRQSVAAGEDHETRKKKLLDFLQAQGIMKPELLNRFDGVIAFRPLEPDQVQAIVRLMLEELAGKLSREQQVTVTFGDDLIQALATTGFDPQFGARPIRRLIQDKVESFLAHQLLQGLLQRGGSLQLTAQTVGL